MAHDNIYNAADHDSDRTENNPQNPPYDTVILIERLKKMSEGDANGERLVHFRKH